MASEWWRGPYSPDMKPHAEAALEPTKQADSEEAVECAALWVSDVTGLQQRCACCGAFKGNPGTHTDDCHLREPLVPLSRLEQVRRESEERRQLAVAFRQEVAALREKLEQVREERDEMNRELTNDINHLAMNNSTLGRDIAALCEKLAWAKEFIRQAGLGHKSCQDMRDWLQSQEEE